MSLIVIPPAVLLTATISGIFGMGGGMILMGVYASLLPVAAAMVLHGVTQLASNGSRAWLLRHHVYWPVLGWFAAGGLVAVSVMVMLAVTVDRTTLFLLLGGLPLLVALLPRSFSFGIESRPVALVAGVVALAAQLMAGTSGPLLDIFFVKGNLDRYQVIATKAIVQTGGHLTKLVYFAWLVPTGDLNLPWWIYPAVVALAFAGTRLGKRVLDRLSDARFRVWSTALVAAIALVFVARGAAGLL